MRPPRDAPGGPSGFGGAGALERDLPIGEQGIRFVARPCRGDEMMGATDGSYGRAEIVRANPEGLRNRGTRNGSWRSTGEGSETCCSRPGNHTIREWVQPALYRSAPDLVIGGGRPGIRGRIDVGGETRQGSKTNPTLDATESRLVPLGPRQYHLRIVDPNPRTYTEEEQLSGSRIGLSSTLCLGQPAVLCLQCSSRTEGKFFRRIDQMPALRDAGYRPA